MRSKRGRVVSVYEAKSSSPLAMGRSARSESAMVAGENVQKTVGRQEWLILACVAKTPTHSSSVDAPDESVKGVGGLSPITLVRMRAE